MNRHLIGAVLAMTLGAGAAHADHCDADIADADAAIAVAASEDWASVADALVEDAIVLCDAEEELIAEAEVDSPFLDPDYVTAGQSMLLHAMEVAARE